MEDSTAVDRFELVLYLRWLVHSRGVTPAARQLGIARATLANLVGGLPVNGSSWASVELAFRKLPEDERQRLRDWFDINQRCVPRMNGTGIAL